MMPSMMKAISVALGRVVLGHLRAVVAGLDPAVDRRVDEEASLARVVHQVLAGLDSRLGFDDPPDVVRLPLVLGSSP